MKLSGLARTLLAAALCAIGGCGGLNQEKPIHNVSLPSSLPFFGRSGDLHVQAVRSIKSVKLRRIAVMPVLESPAGDQSVADGSGETVTAELYSQMSLAAGWEVVPETDVAVTMQKLPPPSPANLQHDAIELGRLVSADAVLYGTVDKYRERVGLDYAAQSPASVAFSLYVVDANLKQVIWSAKFDKTQKALTENVLNIVSFFKTSGRWVRAHEIAMQGVQQAVNDLHGQVNLEQSAKRFETGSYEELKTPTFRYDRRP